MIVFEIIGEILVRIFVEIIFEGIIVGIYRLFKRAIEFIRIRVFGFQPKPITPKKALENKLLYKRIELTENLNSVLKAGQIGAILEIINKEKVFAEFYDEKGNQIEINGDLVFKVGINQLRLINKKRTTTTPKQN
ncbi:hypothetical protein [Tenacibaculum sp. C7A-26P2]|uniref:hypothetical protein n=1 Tax=Tenacibaculum sp. C7A-26P2 TaxID=3447504 RepID=UPI003F84B483